MGSNGPKNLFFYESCRLCLENMGISDVFETEELHQDIFACTGVKITQTDNLPHKVCAKCLDVVKSAKQLRQLALKNDKHLQILFGDPSEEELVYGNDLILLIPESQMKCEFENPEKGKNSDQISSKEKISLLLQNGEENSTKAVPVVRQTITMWKDLFKSSSQQSSPSPTKSKSPVKEDSDEKILKVKVEAKNRCKLIKNGDNEEENRCKRIKIGDDDKVTFYCNDCNKGFETYKKLYLHQRLHNKKIICPLDGCEKKFATKGDLQKHTRTHTGEKPFKCKWCEKGFTQRVSLRQHVLSLHPKDEND